MKTYVTTLFSFLSFSFASSNESASVTNNNASVLSHEVIFNNDSHAISNNEFSKLLKFIKTAKTVAIDSVSVHGFCDDIGGSYDYNLKLSNKRASTIETIVSKYISTNKTSKTNESGQNKIESSALEKNVFTQLSSLDSKVVVIVSPKK